MRISDWSSDVCSSDLPMIFHGTGTSQAICHEQSRLQSENPNVRIFFQPKAWMNARIMRMICEEVLICLFCVLIVLTSAKVYLSHLQQRFSTSQFEAFMQFDNGPGHRDRSEENTSELQSLMRNSYAVFCLNK